MAHLERKNGDARKKQMSMPNQTSTKLEVEPMAGSQQYDDDLDIMKQKASKPNFWKRNIAKTKRNSGEEYVSRSGKRVSAKTFRDVDCLCKMNCVNLILIHEREAIFKRYWNFSSESKLVFICGHVQQVDIGRRRSGLGDQVKRKKTCSYFLPKFDNSMVRVCKVYFRDTLQISNGALGRALKRANDMDFTDRRGKKEPGNKKSKEEIQTIIDHIKSFPTMRSGSSSKSKTSYLPEHLNLKTLYRLYQQSCVYTKPVSETLYKKVFYTKFNLKFKKAAKDKDVCSKCERSPPVKEELKPYGCPSSSNKEIASILQMPPQSISHSQSCLQPQPLLQQPQLDYSHNPLANSHPSQHNQLSHNQLANNSDLSMPINYYRTGMWMQPDHV